MHFFQLDGSHVVNAAHIVRYHFSAGTSGTGADSALQIVFAHGPELTFQGQEAMDKAAVLAGALAGSEQERTAP